MQIYKGAIPFLFIQLFMVSMLIAFPGLVTGSLDKAVDYDLKAVGEQMLEQLGPDAEGGYGGDQGYGSDEGYGADEQADPDQDAVPAIEPDAGDGASQDDDPMKAMQEALERK